ncbi:methyl-accepting chemotaxis protein [Paenibacillus sp. Z6-24]
MRRLQFKSIQARTLATLLPIVLIVLVLISMLSYQFAKQKLNEEMNNTATSSLNGVTASINEQITNNSTVASSLAAAAGQIHEEMNMEDYAQLTERWTMLSSMTYGSGIYFAADAFDDGVKYHSVYAARKGDNISATFEYDDPAYDYLSKPWYTGALGNFDRIYYTEPFIDEKTGTTMITAGKTIRSATGQALGVATSDLNINSIRDYVNNMDIGAVGHALLLDHNGNVLASSEKEIKAGTSFIGAEGVNKAALAAVMSQNKGKTSIQLNGQSYTLYFQTLEGTGWKTGMVLSQTEIQEPAREMLHTLLIIGGISLIVLAGAILWNNLGMIREIRKMMNVSRKMAAGDYSERLEVSRRDEFGQMAVEFNHILEATGTVIQRLDEQSTLIQTTAGCMVEDARQTTINARHNVDELVDMEQGSLTQLQATDESTRAMEEMAAGVQRIAESVQEVASAAQQMEQKTGEGNQQLHKVVKQMDSAKLVMDEAGKMAGSLNERAQQISGIIDVIQGINKQTTLLALNASIEAARAGEAGRGFGVVASEISNLATSVGDSTKMITAQIVAMQEETAAVLMGMESGAVRVTRGLTSLEDTRRMFDSIKSDVEQMSAEIQEVSSASEEMSAGAQQITASLENLADIAQNTSSKASQAHERSAEQLTALDRLETSARSLHTVTDTLNELIAQFQTEPLEKAAHESETAVPMDDEVEHEQNIKKDGEMAKSNTSEEDKEAAIDHNDKAKSASSESRSA